MEFGEKTQIRVITPFKVIKVSINRKPVCDFLLVINTNWHPISYYFGVIAAYFSNFGHCVFEPPFGGLGTMYDVHLGLIGKRVVDFLLVSIELFAMAEAVRMKIDWKSAFCKGFCQYPPNFRVEGTSPTNLLNTDRYANECLTTLLLTVFTRRNFVADFPQVKCDFTRKKGCHLPTILLLRKLG